MKNKIDWFEFKGKKILLLDYKSITDHDYMSVVDYIDDQIKNNHNFFALSFKDNYFGNDHFSDLIRDQKEINHVTETKTEKQFQLNQILFKKTIEEYYKPRQLVNAIYKLGRIPRDSVESIMGIGFIDIANYSFISKFLSPKENQIILNGLFNAFNWVLKKYGGYLNKLEGDSMMIQFGCTLDQKMDKENRLADIAKRLFYSCVEMQRISTYFNEAQERFKKLDVDPETQKSLAEAFSIMSKMRNDHNMAAPMNALFQIRIRIGANIGEVCIGNYGPDDAKQWDIIGVPVIEAKRMEATAPVGGLRISENFYKILDKKGIVAEYYHKIQKQARNMNGLFKNIKKEELFSFAQVTLKDKKNARFNTYSVQVAPDLPESLARQISCLLNHGEFGADKIIELIKYYRGNRLIVKAIEILFSRLGINIRKDKIMQLLAHQQYLALLEDRELPEQAEAHAAQIPLYQIFILLGQIQDQLKKDQEEQDHYFEFEHYDEYIQKLSTMIVNSHKKNEKKRTQTTFFYDVIFTLVFEHIRSGILEYQKKENNR